MSKTGVSRVVGGVGLLAAAIALHAQSGHSATLKAAKASHDAGLTWRQSDVRFLKAKAVLGLPLKKSMSMVRCRSDNTVYFNLDGGPQLSDAAGVPRLYSVTADGEVKSMLRKLPLEFNEVSVLDFFVSEQKVVTLVRATQREDGRVRETRYFLSSLDLQGDFSRLDAVEGHFEPLKVAVLDDGETVVLGWDQANRLPLLAVMKEDGTARRFLEGAFDPGVVATEVFRTAAFVAYAGGNVLLTFPGTSIAAVELNSGGVVRTIPMAMPAGYLLQDVLYSGPSTLVARAFPEPDYYKPRQVPQSQEPQHRLFEFDVRYGTLIRELVPDAPDVTEVTCAGNSSLTAIYYGTVIDSNPASGNASDRKAGAKGGAQLVVSTVPR